MPSFYPENIPQEMKDIAQWVLWKIEQVIDKDTREPEIDLLTGEIKLTKVPYQPNGRKASITDPLSWSSFEVAFAANNPSNFAGLGLVLTKENGIVGVDFDHVPHDCTSLVDGCTTKGWDEGVLTEISDFNSYTELSQSGEGAHVFCKGTIPMSGRKKDNHEMYCDKRFFAVTGNHIKGTPITLNDAQECVTKYYELWFEQSNTKRKSLDNQSRPQSPEMSDEEVLLHCQKAVNSEKFNKLHSGDIDGYHSNSEVQHAYCSLLAFYTQKREQIDRMLRASGLHDEKWGRRGKYTLDKVLNGLTEVYQKTVTESIKQREETQEVEEISATELTELILKQHDDNRIPDLSKLLPDDHFLNIFPSWMSRLTDTYYEFQVCGAFWELSAVTQGKVKLELKQGTIKPNVWFELIGRSTTSRKSTAVNNTSSIWAAVSGEILNNDDFSLEGYLESLSVNPVSNFVRDEVAGLFAKYKQKYNDGIFDAECTLFDGKNYKKTLASKGKKVPETFEIRDPFITHFYATTPDRLQGSLALEDFASGYGIRFLYAYPSYPKARKDIDLEDEEDTEKWGEVVTRLKTLYNYFSRTDSINFKITPEALRTYNNIASELENITDNILDGLLDSAAGRAQDYILKLAILIEIGKLKPSFEITQESIELASLLVINFFLPCFTSIRDLLYEDVKHNMIEKMLKIFRNKNGVCTKSELITLGHFLKSERDSALDALLECGAVEEKINSETKQHIYILKNDNKPKIKIDSLAKRFQNLQFKSFSKFSKLRNG